MSREKLPVTQAVRLLRSRKIAFDSHPYHYHEHGGTADFSRQMGVDEHLVVKTLIMEEESGAPLIALMHGDREVSTKALARIIGCRSVAPCTPQTADRHSGYQVGGTTPFATRRAMPVYCQASILELPRIYINGGKRGYIISLDPADMVRVLDLTPVEIAC